MAGGALVRLIAGLVCALVPPSAHAAGTGGAPPPAMPSYTDPLPADPEGITRAFFTDHTVWNNYSAAHFAQTRDQDGPETAYRRLIDRYCGPAKRHLDITFGSKSAYDPAYARIVGTHGNAARTVVEVHYQYPSPSGYVAQFEFVYLRGDGGRWWLDEIFYYDDHGEQWLPSL